MTAIENDGKTYGFRSLPEDQRALFPQTLCVVCKQKGFYKCGHCDAVYCSAHCQRTDYQQQQHVCNLKNGKEQSSVSAQTGKSSFEDLDTLAQEKFPKDSHIKILSVLSPERVFIRSLEKESNIGYLRTLNDIAKVGLSAEAISSPPEPGDICLALYEPRNIYARILVINVDKTVAHCVFIEFGLIKMIPTYELRQLDNEELKLRKVSVHKIHLKGITDEHGHIEEAMEYLHSLIDKPLEMKAQLEGGNLVDAQLRTVEGTSVNHHINELIIIPIVPANETSFISYASLVFKRLHPGSVKDIIILNRTTIKLDFRVNIIPYEDLSYLEDLQQKLQCYGKKVEKFTGYYTPRINELCLVRNMNTWYRGVLIETAGDCRPTVFLCDFGCLIMARLEDIRKIPKGLDAEVRTTDAIVFGLEEAEKAGVKIDSEFLDIYLEENERLTVQVVEEVEFQEFAELPNSEKTMLSVIKVPELLEFIDERAQSKSLTELSISQKQTAATVRRGDRIYGRKY